MAAPGHLTRRSQALYRQIAADYRLDREPHALEVLRMALESVDRYDQARQAINDEGLTVADRWGGAKPHPLVTVERDSAIRAARLFRELSLDAGIDSRLPRVNGALA